MNLLKAEWTYQTFFVKATSQNLPRPDCPRLAHIAALLFVNIWCLDKSHKKPRFGVHKAAIIDLFGFFHFTTGQLQSIQCSPAVLQTQTLVTLFHLSHSKIAMAPQVEANSLSDITQLASNPPRYPRNPTEPKRQSLTLYIARVPGSRG
jgi:hypothetical protein